MTRESWAERVWREMREEGLSPHPDSLTPCVEPRARWVRCAACRRPIKTCEREAPAPDARGLDSYLCPSHPDGVQVRGRVWACSATCCDYLSERGAWWWRWMGRG